MSRLAMLLLPLCLLLALPAAALIIENPAKPPADPEAAVRAFLDAVPGQNVDAIRDLLADTNTCHITQETDPARPGVWVERWADWLTWLSTHDQSRHVIEKIATAKLTDDLATVTLVGHTAGPQRTDFHAAVVLTRKVNSTWRIISWTQENAPHKEKP